LATDSELHKGINKKPHVHMQVYYTKDSI